MVVTPALIEKKEIERAIEFRSGKQKSSGEVEINEPCIEKLFFFITNVSKFL